MTKRETRVINAFENCVKSGEFSEDYAITLIEDNQRYGWLTDEAKEAFYTFLDEWNKPTVNVNQVTIRSVTPIPAEDSTEPATEEPATEEPATEEPTTEEPTTEEPTTEDPATEEPVSDEPETTAE